MTSEDLLQQMRETLAGLRELQREQRAMLGVAKAQIEMSQLQNRRIAETVERLERAMLRHDVDSLDPDARKAADDEAWAKAQALISLRRASKDVPKN
jgi:hypothetical protein